MRATATAGSQSAQQQQTRRHERPEPLLIERKVSVSPFLATRSRRHASMMRRYSDAILSHFDQDDASQTEPSQGKPESQLRTKNNKRLAEEDSSDLYLQNAAPSLVLLRKRRPDYLDARGWLYWSADKFESFSHTRHDLQRHAFSTGRGKVRVFFVAPPLDEEIELLPAEGDCVTLKPLSSEAKVDNPEAQELRVVESNGDAPSVAHSRRARFVVLEGFEAATQAQPIAAAPTEAQTVVAKPEDPLQDQAKLKSP